MKIGLTGASGFIGQQLIGSLQSKGHTCVAIKRDLLYHPEKGLADILSGCDAVINLAGAPIIQRWTAKNKQTIYSSRVDTTLNLTETIRKISAAKRPKIFISASAVGIYETGMEHDESSRQFDRGFAGTVVQDWEKASEPIPPSTRRVIFRIGVVLGKESQTIKQLVPLFKSRLGGKIGSGQQAFPFVHINDLVSAFEAALTDENYSGIYNLVAPSPINNAEFTKCLSRTLKCPALLPAPAFAIRLMFGKASGLLLEGATVIPQRLRDAGFTFSYPTIEQTLHQILKN